MQVGTCETCGYWIVNTGNGIACAHPARQLKRPTPETLGQYVAFCLNILREHGTEQGMARVLSAISQEGIPTDRMMGLMTPESTCEYHTTESFLPKFDKPNDEPAVFLMGGGPSQVMLEDLLAPHTNRSIWTMNQDRMASHIEDWAAHFDIHVPMPTEHPDIVSRAANKDFTFWTQEKYPFDKILRPDKLHSTIDYVLALIATMHFKHVYLVGIDFWGKREEDVEARGAEYRIGILEGMGVKVWTSPFSSMMQKVVYRSFTGEMTHGTQYGRTEAPIS